MPACRRCCNDLSWERSCDAEHQAAEPQNYIAPLTTCLQWLLHSVAAVVHQFGIAAR